MKRFLVPCLIGAFVVLAIGAGAVAAWGWFYASRPLSLPAARMQIEIESGVLGSRLRGALSGQGVAIPAWVWDWAWRWRGDSRKIRAGVYDLQAPMSIKGLFDRITRGDPGLHTVSLIEGWTFAQVRAALDQHEGLRRETRAWSEATLLRELGVAEPHPEGLFAPDTYAFAPGTSDLDVLRWAYRVQKQRLQRAWQAHQKQVNKGPLHTPYEVLILASIIEKETGLAADRPKVAAVFVNRLRRGMPLQSDPTIIYGLGAAFDGDLRRRDLQRDTPYNTYTRVGLTPTPIAMPGWASIQAALNPAVTPALYFVARGDGSSEFSADLAAHNRAVARYQKRTP